MLRYYATQQKYFTNTAEQTYQSTHYSIRIESEGKK